MIAGSFDSIPVDSDRTNKCLDPRLFGPRLPAAAFETSPLGGAADQADMGDRIAQGRIGDREIERMAVAHDEDYAASGRIFSSVTG